jgi:hypothetical protein
MAKGASLPNQGFRVVFDLPVKSTPDLPGK